MAIVLFWAGFAIIGYFIGEAKGRGNQGALLGLFLGIIGIIIIVCLGEKTNHKRERQQENFLKTQKLWGPPTGPRS